MCLHRFTKRICELTPDESDNLLEYLTRHYSDNHDLQVRYRWQRNDVAIWDNRVTAHTATYVLSLSTKLRPFMWHMLLVTTTLDIGRVIVSLAWGRSHTSTPNPSRVVKLLAFEACIEVGNVRLAYLLEIRIVDLDPGLNGHYTRITDRGSETRSLTRAWLCLSQTEGLIEHVATSLIPLRNRRAR